MSTDNSVIRFEQVTKAYGSQKVLEDFSLSVPRGAFLTMIGRSGCGKTTALKLVNGLITPDHGRVLVDGVDVAQTDPITLRRRIGYAIQGVGLFPHMTVAENVCYVPSLSARQTKDACVKQVTGLLEQVGLDLDIAGRYPRELSGGQRQRVGIARALAADPDLLLMDEPFGAVDEITREQLQDEILRIHRERNITILFVTHDIAEAVKLGTRMLVLGDHGKTLQYASPREIIDAPASDFVSYLVNHGRQLSCREDS